jgi:hypothetical protein
LGEAYLPVQPPEETRRRVLVHTVDGIVYEGTVVKDTPEGLSLADTYTVYEGETVARTKRVRGEAVGTIHLPRSAILRYEEAAAESQADG